MITGPTRTTVTRVGLEVSWPVVAAPACFDVAMLWACAAAGDAPTTADVAAANTRARDIVRTMQSYIGGIGNGIKSLPWRSRETGDILPGDRSSVKIGQIL